MTSVVFNADCMDVMKEYPDKYFDLAVCDPPYFSGPERRGFYGKEVATTGVRRVDYPKTAKWIIPDSEYFRELERVSKHYIIWGCNYFQYIFTPGRIVWDKCNGSSTFSDCEIAATNCHDSVRLFRYIWNGMMQGQSISRGEIQRGDKTKNEKRIHPTQKPTDLYRWIFQNYAKPGYKILDTHLGSGRSRLAACEAGLNFVGCEIEKVYFDLQEESWDEFMAQTNLFLRCEKE